MEDQDIQRSLSLKFHLPFKTHRNFHLYSLLKPQASAEWLVNSAGQAVPTEELADQANPSEIANRIDPAELVDQAVLAELANQADPSELVDQVNPAELASKFTQDPILVCESAESDDTISKSVDPDSFRWIESDIDLVARKRWNNCGRPEDWKTNPEYNQHNVKLTRHELLFLVDIAGIKSLCGKDLTVSIFSKSWGLAKDALLLVYFMF